MPSDSLASIPASSVSAFGGIIKDMLGASLPQLALVLVAIVIVIAIRKNTKITLFNSDQNVATRKALNDHSEQLKGFDKRLKDSEASLTIALKGSSDSLRFEVEKVKSIVNAAQTTIDQKLSMIPKVEAAIDDMKKRQDALEKNDQIIITGLKNLRKGGPV